MIMTDELDEKIQKVKSGLEDFNRTYEELQEEVSELREEKENLEKEIDVKASNIDVEKLQKFLDDDYWLINKIDEENYEIYIPYFIDVQAGVLDRHVNGFNVFKLDNITKLISGIPDKIEDEVDLSDEQRFQLKGDLLEFAEGQKEVVEEELGDYVTDVKDEKATVKADKGQALVEDLLRRGEIPFTPAPVDEEDLREPETEHELRDYQQDALEEWLEYGAITVCFMTGAGKTHVGIEALDRLKYDPETGRKAVVAYNRLVAIQWKNRIEKYAPRMKPVMMAGKTFEDLPEDEEIVEIYTYHGMHTIQEIVNSGREYIMIQMDEGDYIGADQWSTASTFPMKYRMGHTASPVRSKEEPYKVFSLLGKPVGLDWKETLKLMDKSMFPVNLHVVREESDKIDRVKEVLEDDKVTVLVVENVHEDSIGQELKEELGLRFVHGQTSGDPLENIHDAIEEDNAVIASRIVRRGATIEGIQRLIEVDRRGDSRRDTIQVLGRLFHGRGEQADLIYTAGEANSFEETFLGILGKEYNVNDVDDAIELPDTSGVIEADFQSDIDFDQRTRPDNPGQVTEIQEVPSTGEISREEFVNDDEVKEKIKNWIDESSAGEKSIKRIIAALVEFGELSRDELQQKTGRSSSILSKAKSPISGMDKPPVKIEDGTWDLNIEMLEEIRKSQKTIEQLDSRVEDFDF
jgi:superfamily II DNA or RNA helicase